MSKKIIHPQGLWVICKTKLSERLGHYGLKSILALYFIGLISDGGLGWSEDHAKWLVGVYIMTAYMSCIPGGDLGDIFDRWRVAYIGTWILCAGHLTMAIATTWSAYIALALIGIGVGLQKPNLQTLLSETYDNDKRYANKKARDAARKAGYDLLYVYTNIGALIGTIFVPLAAEYISWHVAFGIAGVAALYSQNVFSKGKKHVTFNEPLSKEKKARRENFSLRYFLIWPFQLASFPFTVWSDLKNQVERDHMKLLFYLFFLCALFWSAFEQGAGLITLYANVYVDRTIDWLGTIPAGSLHAVNPICVAALSGTIAYCWSKHKEAGKDDSYGYYSATALLITAVGFISLVFATLCVIKTGQGANTIVLKKASMIWIVIAFFLHSIGELCLVPVMMDCAARLSPKRYASLMQGIEIATLGIGGIISGLIGSLSDNVGETAVFAIIAGYLIAGSVVTYCIRGKLKSWEHLDDSQEAAPA